MTTLDPAMPCSIDPADVALCLADSVDPDVAGATPVTVPIVQTSLFTFPHFQALLDGLAAEERTHVYTRGRNPTVEALERKLAALERGEACACFASGMAAISAVLLGLLRSGDHVLFVNQTYGPTLQLARHLERFGIRHDVLLDIEPAAVEHAIRPETRLIWLESPGTMLLRMVDLAAVADIARARGIPTCIDNTWATPLLQKPVTLGIDIVVHTCSKYIGGHSDVMAGAVISTSERMREIFFRAFLLNGGILAPAEAWLLLRGLRTLPVRMREHGASALAVARFLASHPAVQHVYHPALDSPALVAKQLRGCAGLLGFALRRDDFDSVRRVIDGLRVFRIGVSWGGVESLVLSPNRGDNAAQLDAQRIPRGLIRLSVGLEPVDALIHDLGGALAAVEP